MRREACAPDNAHSARAKALYRFDQSSLTR
jgi:hypothetical protein